MTIIDTITQNTKGSSFTLIFGQRGCGLTSFALTLANGLSNEKNLFVSQFYNEDYINQKQKKRFSVEQLVNPFAFVFLKDEKLSADNLKEKIQTTGTKNIFCVLSQDVSEESVLKIKNLTMELNVNIFLLKEFTPNEARKGFYSSLLENKNPDIADDVYFIRTYSRDEQTKISAGTITDVKSGEEHEIELDYEKGEWKEK